jgi:hypothetical protein
MTNRLAPLCLLILSLACSTDQPPQRTARIDTLPGGIVRTISDAPLGWTDTAGAWKLVLLHEIQPAEGDSGELFDPQDLAMNERGDIFVKDQKPDVIKVFDASGMYRRSIGRQGSGPGEFRVAFIAVRGDTLITQDPQNSRITTFNAETGATLATWRSTCCYWFPIALDGQGRVVFYAMGQDSTRPNAQAIVRARLDGTGMDTAWATQRPRDESKLWTVTQGKEMQMMMAVPYQTDDVHGVDPVGALLSGWNGEYLLRTTRDGRDTVALFGRTWTPEPVSGAEREAIVEKRIKEQEGSGVPEAVFRTAFKPEYIPDTKPSFISIEGDPAGNRWLRLESGDTLQVHYDVFDPAGRWLGPVTVPRAQWSISYQRPAWGRDRVAVLGEGEDGRPVVRVFRIEKPPVD